MTCESLDRGTLYAPHATSLRMSDIGYRNRNQAGLSVSVNSLDEYVRDLTRAITTPHPPYEALGVNVDGEWRQLNANILQIENEYYSFIRPKRVALSGERPTRALRRAGVEYVEVRALDVSAFDPVGVNQNKMRFLEAFLALCLLKDSPPIGASEQDALDENHLHRGAPRAASRASRCRATAARCRCCEWARELIDSMRGICEVLDKGDPLPGPTRRRSRSRPRRSRTCASRPRRGCMTELQATGESFFDLALRTSVEPQELLPRSVHAERRAARGARREAEESLRRQREIEAADREPSRTTWPGILRTSSQYSTVDISKAHSSLAFHLRKARILRSPLG